MMYRFGKNPPKKDYRTLKLSRYFTPDLPPPPPAVSNVDRVIANLGGGTVPALFPMDGNDEWGDCTIAAVAHAITCWHGLIGRHLVPRASTVVKTYFRLSGGVDSGLNMLDVCNYWRKHSISADRILAYASVTPRKHFNVKTAINLFGGLYVGFQCQDRVMEDFDAGIPWTPGRLTNSGHAVYAVDYNEDFVKVLTWGGIQSGTWEWWDECVDEAFAIIPPEARKAPFAPGIDFAALEHDLELVAQV